MLSQEQADFIVKVQAQITRKQKEIIKNWNVWDVLKMKKTEEFIKRKQKLIRFAKSGKMDFSKYSHTVQNGLQKGLAASL